jgi:four helix bundle protein
MSIASKEARETNYFLRLLRDSGLVKENSLFKEIVDAFDESNQIKRILTAVVKTSQTKTEVKKSKR